MKETILKLKDQFFSSELDLRVRMFNLLATAGILNCVAMILLGIFNGISPINILLNALSGVLALFLLHFSQKTGRYQFCYTVTILGIFIGLFAFMCLTSDGYRGGMPSFFIFAIVFTVYMLDGRKMFVVVSLEAVFYTGLCLFAYCYPQYVTSFDSEAARVIDIVVGFLVVSLLLGYTMFAQFQMYQKQQKQLELARTSSEMANQAKSTFLANMSHEIRTPIHIILGMNEAIKRATNSGKVLECARKIDEAGAMLQALVDNVLDVSKIESGKMELLPDVFETTALVSTLKLLGSVRSEKKNLIFQMEVDQQLPIALYGDLLHIKQIATNLLSNAVKYTEQGSVTLSIGQKPSDLPDQILLCITVSDTGIGIHKDAVPTLFDSFIRADLTAHRHIEGTGLGLAIVKKLTELMDGSIRVESEYGVGSTFSVELPLTVATALHKTQREQAKTFLAPAGRVLVVDDNEENLAVLRSLLERTQLQVDTVCSGMACLAAVEEKSYHVILMDYMMPEMDGIQTITALKALPNFATPVISLTANAVAGTEQLLLDAGFAAYITKPVAWGKLESLLLQYLPQQLVTELLLEGPDSPLLEGLRAQIGQQLPTYDLDLDRALDYFGGDLQQYQKTLTLFLHNYPMEREKIQQLWEQGDFPALRFLVHALKGKAKNMGAERLFETAERVELLCKNDETAEAQSLMPYLLYLWGKSVQGLSLMRETLLALLPDEIIEETVPDPIQCLQRLPDLLRALRRQPALQCLNSLLAMEPQEEGKALLNQTKQAVVDIAFDRAGQLFADYITLREGRKS